jgi:hypothetical protein
MVSISKKVILTVTATFISKPVPEEEIENFNNWLFWTGAEYGVGDHNDYYNYGDNYLDDIHVNFKVSLTTIKND